MEPFSVGDRSMYRAPGPDGALRLGPEDQNIVCDYYYTQPLLVVGLGLAHWPGLKTVPCRANFIPDAN